MITVPLKHGDLLLDDEDAHLLEHRWISHYKTRRHISPYVMRKIPCGHCKARYTTLPIHKVILPCSGLIDHANGNGLDNTRSNLRCADHSKNSRNSRKRVTNLSGYKGVSQREYAGSWRARIYTAEGVKQLGTFHDKQQAALEYDRAVRTYFGEYGRFNFPNPGERGLDGIIHE